MPPLSSKVVAVTGASSGIGEATVRAAAAAGARVMACARRTDRLARLVDEVRGRGGEAIAVAGDVAREADMAALVDRTIAAFGRLDVMVCNAGIGYHGLLDETPPDAMRRLVEVNVLGTFYAARAALVVMRRQRAGHIIAVSSIAGRRGVGGSSVYSATKAAQVGFIEGLRAEFQGTPLRASIVYPVSTVTEFHDAIARDFGHTVRGKGPRQSADVVARAIVRCMVSPRPEVYPYRPAWLLSVLSVIAPAQADRLMRRFGRRRTPDPATHGPQHS
ncbi:MAG: SDR family NAD(P)-dependent oxidoreductase [Acidobacteria bacterium]|nr:SDR family NAD(P)-dependent oxidoreductase [Acidobacteriota bacterium]